MAKRVFLIHGWGGNPYTGWKPWLREELEKRGFEVFAPEMPDTNHPKMNAWVDHLSNIVGEPDENCYFVGHSLGCATILRYLETLMSGKKIGGVVLVAGPVERKKDDDIKNFFLTLFDWNKIRNHCEKFIGIYSDDDPVVPLKDGNVLEEKLGAKLIVEHKLGHISSSDGVTKLQSALNSVLELEKG